MGRGDGTFREPIEIGNGEDFGQVYVVDLDDDGHSDLLCGEYHFSPDSYGNIQMTAANIAVRLGSGDGTFADPIRYPLTNYSFVAFIGDFDGDGHTDISLVTGSDPYYTTQTYSLRFGLGDGSFAPEVPSTPVGGQPFGDLNGDGRDDLIGSDPSGFG